MKQNKNNRIYVAKDLRYFVSDWSALADHVTVDGKAYKRLTAHLWDQIDRNIDSIIESVPDAASAVLVADYYAELLALVVDDMIHLGDE